MAAKKAVRKVPVAKSQPRRAPATASTLAAAAKPRKQSSAVAAPALDIGARAPAFELGDEGGALVRSASLVGQPYVLYFYPRDNTPGCTREAQGFRDAARDFAEAGVRVIGVSPDSSASHGKFCREQGLSFTLLSDPERVLARAYGVYGPKKMMGRESLGIIRSTFLVDAAGVVRRAWRGVRVDGHVAAVLAAARGL